MKRRRAAVYVLGDPGAPPSNEPFHDLNLISYHVMLNNCLLVASYRDRDDATYFAGFEALWAFAAEGTFEVIFIFTSSTNLLHPRLLEFLDILKQTRAEVKCVFDFHQESLR